MKVICEACQQPREVDADGLCKRCAKIAELCIEAEESEASRDYEREYEARMTRWEE